MARFVVLGHRTDQGARTAKETVNRTKKVRQEMQRLGGEMKHVWRTMGSYDVVAVFEAPDDETATAMMVAVAGMGKVRTETLRAFDADEVKAILAKVG
jgi:uncharacterized protein with GYD domain